MTLPELSLRRPILATVLSLMILLLGAMAMTRLPVRELPDIDAARITINVQYAGAAPEVMDSQVTTVIEGALAGLAGLVAMESEAERGRSRTILEFDTSRDIDAAANDVRAALDRVVNNLPDGAEAPSVRKNDDEADPVVRLSLASPTLSARELSDYADRFVVDRLSRLPGVSNAVIYGERKPAMRVWLDTTAMSAHGVTARDVIDALQANNVELPAGEIETPARQIQILARTRFSSADQFAALAVRDDGARPVLLGDVARIEAGAENEDTLFRSDFRNSVGIGIQRQSQANTVAISHAVRAEVESLSRQLPPGMTLSVATDEALFIEASIREVAKVFLEAVLLVTAVIFLFLGSARASLIPIVTIPISIVGAAMGMLLLGFSLNLLTLFALILSIGLVVDDAIVVLENIQRRLALGEARAAACRNGTNQVNFAVIATTAVLIAVFLPVSFMEGEIGRLFSEFGIVLAIAVGISGVVALTLSPVLAARLLPEASGAGWLERRTNAVVRGMEHLYRAALARVLDHPIPAFAFIAFFVGSAVAVYDALPRELIPDEDRGRVVISIMAPQGSNLAHTDRITRDVEGLLQPVIDEGLVDNVTTIVGTWGEIRRAIILVSLVPWEERAKSVREVIAELRPLTDRVDGASVSLRPGGGIGIGGNPGGLDIVLGAPDVERAAAWGAELTGLIEAHPGLANARVSYAANQPGVTITVDRERARDLGLESGNVAQTLQALFASRSVGEYTSDGRQYPVVVQATRADRDSLDDLDAILMRNSRGDLVPVSNFARIVPEATAPEIDRYDRVHAVDIDVDLVGGQDLGEAIAFVEEAVTELPVGATLAWKGQARHFIATSQGVAMVFALALAIVFLVLAAQFESFLSPVIILLTVPVGLAGAAVSLWLAGQSVNIYSQVGLVLLVGLMAKNGILLVEFVNQLRAEGRALREAVLEGAATRFRPIVMTTIATVLGAVPLATATGAGAESRAAIGLVIAGGLSFAFVLTLFLTPLIYEMVGSLTERKPQAPAPEPDPVAAE